MTASGLDVAIVVRDLPRAISFYVDTVGLEDLGASVLEGFGTIHRLGCGASAIKIVLPDDMPEASSPPGGPSKATGVRYLSVLVDDCEAGAERAREAGHRVIGKVRSPVPGVRHVFLEDPEGNWVELLERS